MGLDQYAYSRPPRKRNSDDDVQLMEWRKHNRLQGWMQQLWENKGCPNAQTEGDEMGDFNCVELQLTAQDIVTLNQIPINSYSDPTTISISFNMNVT